MAVEKARASGVPIEMVVVGDDVGVGRAKAGKVGRRGIAGTVLVVKAAGAAAEKGASLADVHKVALQVSENLISVGASLAHVHVPGRVADDEDDGLGADEIELGMGIHNEPGSERLKGVDLASLVKTMLTRLLDQSDSDRAFLNVKSSDKVVALINNLGGVSPLEFGAITHEALAQLKSTYQIVPVRVLAGTYMTSLNGPGFSISLLRVQDTGLGSGMQVLDLLDAPTEAAGWVPSADPQTWTLEGGRQFDSVDPSDESAGSQPSGITIDPAIARDVFAAGLKRVIAAEPEVTRFDTVVGDGDCGTGLKRGAEAVQALLDNPDTAQIKDLSVLLDRVAGVVEDTMDGTSGALYAIFVNALNHGLRVAGSKQPGPVSVQNHWVPALESALEGLGRYTPAKVGDRTLVDALAPFVTGLKESGNVNAAAGKARDGAEKTKGMGASLGRTVYIGGSGFKEVPDPGAWGLSEFFLGLGEATGK
jgi:triose/dihydroxyacetone kinase / FAD-AMP lyase (cyclizing)